MLPKAPPVHQVRSPVLLRREPLLNPCFLSRCLNNGTRDLKPRNVMLGMDGHIQLADMGGVGDCFGDMSARKVRD